MTVLSDVPWEELKLGDKVCSALGNLGRIIDLVFDRDVDKCVITIQWNHGGLSQQPHNLLDRVQWIGHADKT